MAIEGLPLHFTLFSKIWSEIYNKSHEVLLLLQLGFSHVIHFTLDAQLESLIGIGLMFGTTHIQFNEICSLSQSGDKLTTKRWPMKEY